MNGLQSPIFQSHTLQIIELAGAGFYDGFGSIASASYRYGKGPTNSLSIIGFRSALYVNL